MADSTTAPETGNQVNVLEIINSRLAGLTDDKFHLPPFSEMEEGVIKIGDMTDHQKRLWTLVYLVDGEHRASVMELARLHSQIDGAMAGPGTAVERLKNVVSGVTTEMLEAYQAAQLDHSLKCELNQVVRALFWLDIRTCFLSELGSRPDIGVRDDWSVVMGKSTGGGMTVIVMGSASLMDIFGVGERPKH